MDREKPKKRWLDAADLKQRVSIESVLDAYDLKSNLERRGEQLVGRSPFRPDDESRSFSVNVERGIWNDGASRPIIETREVAGNVIGLVQALEGCSFRQALETLDKRFVAGVSPITVETLESRGAVRAALRQERLDEKGSENPVFGKELGGLRFDVPWLQDVKGVSEATARLFRVGYCSRGLMKGRVVFPIRNASGAIVAYAGRSVKENDATGKYRFPSGFKKEQELFNIDRVANDEATQAVVAKRGLVVVKGFSDVLRLSQNGILNVVALMGNDFSQTQLRLLLSDELNPSQRVTIFLDNDAPGNAAKRKLAAALIYRSYVRFADYDAVPGVEKTEPERFSAKELACVLR